MSILKFVDISWSSRGSCTSWLTVQIRQHNLWKSENISYLLHHQLYLQGRSQKESQLRIETEHLELIFFSSSKSYEKYWSPEEKFETRWSMHLETHVSKLESAAASPYHSCDRSFLVKAKKAANIIWFLPRFFSYRSSETVTVSL